MHKSLLLAAALAIPSWSAEAQPWVGKPDYIATPESSPVELGRGYDSLTGEFKDVCVDFSTEVNTTGSGDLAHEWHSVTTSTALAGDESFGLKAAFQISNVPVDVAYSNYNSQSFSSFSQWVRVTQSIDSGNETAKTASIRINQKGRDYLRQFGRVGFLRYCGDKFVSVRLKGARLTIAFSLKSETQTQANENNAGITVLKANSISSNSSTISAMSKNIIDTKVFVRGPLIVLPAMNFQAVDTYARNFPAEVRKQGKDKGIIGVSVSDYGGTLALLIQEFANSGIKIPTAPPERQLVIRRGFQHLNELIVFRSDLYFAQENPLLVPPMTPGFREDLQGKVNSHLRDLKAWGDDCLERINKSDACTDHPKLSFKPLSKIPPPGLGFHTNVAAHCGEFVIAVQPASYLRIIRLTGAFKYGKSSDAINGASYMNVSEPRKVVWGEVFREGGAEAGFSNAYYRMEPGRSFGIRLGNNKAPFGHGDCATKQTSDNNNGTMRFDAVEPYSKDDFK